MTAHLGQTTLLCLDTRECEQLPVTIMLTWKPNTLLQQFQRATWQSTIQGLCKTAKTDARLRTVALLGLIFSDVTTFGSVSTCNGGEAKVWQHGDLKPHHTEEECESVLIARHRWNTVAWPLHKDDTHFNRNSCSFHFSHV